MANGAQVLSELGFEPVVSRVTLHEGVYQRLSLARWPPRERRMYRM